MDEKIEQLTNWFNQAANFTLPEWDNLPDLDLYMDQVITYLERILAPLAVTDEDKLITTWMINNYVKSGAIPVPSGKKYSKDHLANILLICVLKQVLSISDIRSLKEMKNESGMNSEKIYDDIKNYQKKCMEEETKKVQEILNQENLSYDSAELKKKFVDYVVQISIEADAKKIVATKLLSELSNIQSLNSEKEILAHQREALTKEEKRKAKKDKEKEKDKDK